MAWEDRGGHRYYYRKRREGRRVVSEYVGTGPLAEAIGTLTHCDRIRAALARETARQERAELEVCDEPLAELATLLHTLTAATLVTNGYHQHKRQWRRRRGPRD